MDQRNGSGGTRGQPSLHIVPEGMDGDAVCVEIVVRPRNGTRPDFRAALPLDVLLEAIREVAAGRPWNPPRSHRKKPDAGLTQAEESVARLVAMGMRNSEVAQRLFITEGTVKTHLNNAFRKLRLRNRTELTLRALAMGLVRSREQGEYAAADHAA